MAKWICKVTAHPEGQRRMTLPKGLVELMDWRGVRYVVLEDVHDGILIRRFKDGESLQSYKKDDSTLSD